MKKNVKKVIDNIFVLWSSVVYFSIYFTQKNKKIQVKTIDETIADLLNNRYSIIRFGDADLNLIAGESQKYQVYSDKLRSRLIECANTEHQGLMIAIPDIFDGLFEIKPSAKRYWYKHLLTKRKTWEKVFNKKTYYNAFVTRLYVDYNVDYEIISDRFKKIKEIWNGRDIVIIEGDQSRLGVGNDLFNNAKSIKRILCPNKNAFSYYNDILDKTLNVSKDSLILVALGPTARPLVLDLYLQGYQAIDIGHIDVEYEWFLRKVKTKTQISNKYVNEVSNYTVEDCNDDKYLNEIMDKIIINDYIS